MSICATPPVLDVSGNVYGTPGMSNVSAPSAHVPLVETAEKSLAGPRASNREFASSSTAQHTGVPLAVTVPVVTATEVIFSPSPDDEIAVNAEPIANVLKPNDAPLLAAV